MSVPDHIKNLPTQRGSIIEPPPQKSDPRAERLASVQKVVGEAVHPSAVERLVALWPEAEVKIRHMDGARDGVRSRVTRLEIVEGPPTGSEPRRVALGEARCRLDSDVWQRRRGIHLAFERALKTVKRRTAPGLEPGIGVRLFGPRSEARGFVLSQSPGTPGRGFRLVRLTTPVQIGEIRHVEGEVLELRADELVPIPMP